jgi:hypothetical protein
VRSNFVNVVAARRSRADHWLNLVAVLDIDEEVILTADSEHRGKILKQNAAAGANCL